MSFFNSTLSSGTSTCVCHFLRTQNSAKKEIPVSTESKNILVTTKYHDSLPEKSGKIL